MDEKNAAALANPGAKKLLAEFMNLAHPDDAVREQRLKEFRDKYGPLIAEGEEHFPPSLSEALCGYALGFGMALGANWKVSSFQVEGINKLLDGILGSGMYAVAVAQAGMESAAISARPALRTDFIGGRWEPVPRTLLDVLAIELVHSRKALSRCVECERYFVKTHNKDKTCSAPCSEERSSRRKSEWQKENKRVLNQRRRKTKRRGEN